MAVEKYYCTCDKPNEDMYSASEIAEILDVKPRRVGKSFYNGHKVSSIINTIIKLEGLGERKIYYRSSKLRMERVYSKEWIGKVEAFLKEGGKQ